MALVLWIEWVFSRINDYSGLFMAVFTCALAIYAYQHNQLAKELRRLAKSQDKATREFRDQASEYYRWIVVSGLHSKDDPGLKLQDWTAYKTSFEKGYETLFGTKPPLEAKQAE